MSRWWRCYADTHRNQKIATLSDKDFRLWHRLLCVASENDGMIPPPDQLKRLVGMRYDHLKGGLRRLISCVLIEALGDGYCPHNWDKRQYKSDTSTDRVRKHRAERNVPVTPPDTETDNIEEKKDGGAVAPNGKYAFQGSVIRLTAAHLKLWSETYHTIRDMRAELVSLDAWWDDQPPEKRKKWFHPTMGMLNRKHQENLEAVETYDPDRITV
jgi:hypothetical protein